MSKKILIVEDNVLNMKLFNDVLDANGYVTQQSTTGLDAYDLCLSFEPDLVILDIQLPEISGFDIIKKIRSNPTLKDLPVIAITAFAMHGDEERILSAGCSAYLSKPISVGRFLEYIEHYASLAA
jgi:two-component system cell cycle response regulator DivK